MSKTLANGSLSWDGLCDVFKEKTGMNPKHTAPHAIFAWAERRRDLFSTAEDGGVTLRSEDETKES